MVTLDVGPPLFESGLSTAPLPVQAEISKAGSKASTVIGSVVTPVADGGVTMS